jgi:hypothetical protein
MTNEPKAQNWEEQQLAELYEAVMQRMVITYCLNELVKTGIKTGLKDGVIEHLRAAQKQANFRIVAVVRRIDRGTQS